MAKRKQSSKATRGNSIAVVGYRALLTEIKRRIETAQIKASLAVNRELIQLYWDIGRRIVEQQEAKGWGAGVVDQLAADLQKAYPSISGFSASNISRMRAFFRAYSDLPLISAQVVPKSNKLKSARAVPKTAAHLPPVAVTNIPWGHNVVLLFKIRRTSERLWYATQAVENGWSRSMLEHWIESKLYARQGKPLQTLKTCYRRSSLIWRTT